jgi:hypothetical protein
MKTRISSLALAAAVLLAASAASAAVPGVQPSGAQVPVSASTMDKGNSGQRVTYFNKQGKDRTHQPSTRKSGAMLH